MQQANRFTRSWIDAFVEWIERLPAPVWFVYAVGILMTALLVNAVLWIDGSLPIGQLDSRNTAFAIFVLFWFGLYQYLTNVAARALETFRPLLDEEHADLPRIRFELGALPRGWGWIAVVLGLGFALLNTLGQPPSYGGIVPRTPLVPWADFVVTAFLSVSFFCVIFRSIRQLRTVSRLHDQATNINILHLRPAHAFSALTSRTGIGIILLLVFGYLYDPSAFDTSLSLASYAATVIIAVAVFVVPVIGLRRKLEEAKADLLDNTSSMIQAASEALKGDLLKGEYGGMKEKEAAIRALTLQRELYSGVPTWPWNPVLLRGFTSALLLPIFLWLVTRLLERLL